MIHRPTLSKLGLDVTDSQVYCCNRIQVFYAQPRKKQLDAAKRKSF